MSCASLPDTNLCLAATFHIRPAMLGDSLSIVKETTPCLSWRRCHGPAADVSPVVSQACLAAPRFNWNLWVRALLSVLSLISPKLNGLSMDGSLCSLRHCPRQ